MMYSFIGNKPESMDWTMNKMDVAHPHIDPLPSGAKGYTMNNQFQQFPPLMNDGRSVLSSWQTTHDVNATMYETSGMKTNFEYRRYMINNAKQLMETNMANILSDSGFHDSMANARQANFTYLEPHAIQTASNYIGYTQQGNNSDLMSRYLSREELEQRKRPVVMTQEDMLKLRKQY